MIGRAFLAGAGVASLALAALWTYALLEVLAAEWHPTLAPYERRALIILGALGIGAFVIAGGCGLAYARAARRRWLTPVIAGIVCAVPVLVAWIALYEVYPGSD